MFAFQIEDELYLVVAWWDSYSHFAAPDKTCKNHSLLRCSYPGYALKIIDLIPFKDCLQGTMFLPSVFCFCSLQYSSYSFLFWMKVTAFLRLILCCLGGRFVMKRHYTANKIGHSLVVIVIFKHSTRSPLSFTVIPLSQQLRKPKPIPYPHGLIITITFITWIWQSLSQTKVHIKILCKYYKR